MAINALKRGIRDGKQAARRVLPRPVVDKVDAWLEPADTVETTVLDGYSLRTMRGLLVIDPEEPSGEPPVGIYLFGGCDLPSMFSLGPIVGPTTTRQVVVHLAGNLLSMARADVLRQSIAGVPGRAAAEVIEKMQLPSRYFEPILFEPTFRTKLRELGELRRSAILISGGGSVIRAAYRHKEHGFLVDPAPWLRGKEALDPKLLKWFTTSFERVGLLPVEQFVEDFAVVVRELRAHTDAEILLFNTLTVEPGASEHNYQLRRHPEGVRRLEFHVAMHELAGAAGFHVVDVDDALKRHGIRDQLDFAHFPVHAYQPVALEAARVLREAGVL